MTRYAKINAENVVENTIVCDDFTISSMPGVYIKITESTGDASIEHSYLPEENKFIRPKPYESWLLNTEFEWESPLGENPNPALKCWDEESQNWIDRF
jgi:hypothetical protein